MIMAAPIFHIIPGMINTMHGSTGITTIQGVIRTKDITAILLTMKIIVSITMMTTAVTITSIIETIINSLAII